MKESKETKTYIRMLRLAATGLFKKAKGKIPSNSVIFSFELRPVEMFFYLLAC